MRPPSRSVCVPRSALERQQTMASSQVRRFSNSPEVPGHNSVCRDAARCGPLHECCVLCLKLSLCDALPEFNHPGAIEHRFLRGTNSFQYDIEEPADRALGTPQRLDTVPCV